jgi:hypothetical protein
MSARMIGIRPRIAREPGAAAKAGNIKLEGKILRRTSQKNAREMALSTLDPSQWRAPGPRRESAFFGYAIDHVSPVAERVLPASRAQSFLSGTPVASVVGRPPLWQPNHNRPSLA